MSYYALVPAWNEARNIKQVLDGLKKFPHVKPIVIDDGSTDATGTIVKEMGIQVIRHEENLGKGEAINTGFNYVLDKLPDAEFVVLIDADMQYLPEEVGRILKPLEEGEADFVMGYRDWGKVPFRHKLANFVWRILFNVLFGTRLKDTNCGYMGFTADAVRKVKGLHGGYIIENTILIEVLKNRLRVKQVPVSVNYKHKSGMSRGIRMVAGISYFILSEGLKHRFGKNHRP